MGGWWQRGSHVGPTCCVMNESTCSLWLCEYPEAFVYDIFLPHKTTNVWPFKIQKHAHCDQVDGCIPNTFNYQSPGWHVPHLRPQKKCKELRSIGVPKAGLGATTELGVGEGGPLGAMIGGFQLGCTMHRKRVSTEGQR